MFKERKFVFEEEGNDRVGKGRVLVVMFGIEKIRVFLWGVLG